LKKAKEKKKSKAKGKKKDSKKRDRLLELITKDIWPQERDYLERPGRYKYVRKLVEEKGCVFCKAAKGKVGFENLCLYQDDDTVIVLNKYPYNSGHLLVLPRRHMGQIWDLKAQENGNVAAWIQKSVKILKDVYDCDGFNVGLNHGAAAGAGLPEHLHWHIIPRWSGDTNFFPLIAETKTLPETLEQTYNKLKDMFAEGKIKDQ
jgi:ATP adenylyltransferase